jgi:hypothetical protein
VCNEAAHSAFDILDSLQALTGFDATAIKNIANKHTLNLPIVGRNESLKEIGWQSNYDLTSGLQQMVTANKLPAAGI